MRRLSLALAALPLLALAPAPARSTDPVIATERWSLANGLQVIVSEDHRVPLVAVSLWYHVGARDDTAGKSGYAHLFEHMMFERTQHLGNQTVNSHLAAIGGSEINGFTSAERTDFHELVPSNQLEAALWIESDRMGFFEPALSDERLGAQRDVVRAERRQHYDDAPWGRERFAIAKALYPPGNPLRQAIIGIHEDLERATLDDVKGFFHTWYGPANCTLVLAGDVDPGAARPMIEKWFGPIPGAPKPKHSKLAFSPLAHASSETLEDPFVRLQRVSWNWISPGAMEPGEADLEVLASVLSARGSGRLDKILVHQKQLAVSVSARQASAEHAFRISVTLHSNAAPLTVRKILEEELNRARSGDLDAADVARARAIAESSRVWGLESLVQRAEALQFYDRYAGTPSFLAKDLARIGAVTPASIAAVASMVLDSSKRAEVITIPHVAGTMEVTDDDDAEEEFSASTGEDRHASNKPADQSFRARQPAAGPATPFHSPNVEVFVLGDGLTVHLLEQHGLPIVRLKLVTPGGSMVDPPGREGAATVCMAQRPVRTTALDGEQMRDALGELGSEVAAGATADSEWVSFSSFTRNLDATLALWADVLLRPSIRQVDLASAVQTRIDRGEQDKAVPRTVALWKGMIVGWGAAHPYVRVPTKVSLSALTVADCTENASRWLVPGGAHLFVVGDVTRKELLGKLPPLLEGWKGKAKIPPRVAPAHPSAGRIFLVDSPGASTSVVEAVAPGPDRSASDYFATDFAIKMIGTRNGRLNSSLREQHGWAYGAEAGFSYYREGGSLFTATATVRRDATADSIKEIHDQLVRFQRDGPSAKWVESLKTHAAMVRATKYATSREALRVLELDQYFARPADEADRLPALLAPLDAGKVRKAAADHIDVAGMRYVVVGDVKSVREPLEQLLSSGDLGDGELVYLE